MELVLPSEKYKDSFIEAVKEYQANTEVGESGKRYGALALSDLENDFGAYVAKERSYALGQNLPVGFIPSTTFWLIDNDQFIGRVSIRHELTQHLLQIGGHIGYDIRPSMRGRGYGSKILELALPKARELGIEKVLLTCDESNIGSHKRYNNGA